MINWAHLKKISKMETIEDRFEFERTVWEIASKNDPEVIGNLIELFDDDCAYPEIMYSLVHAIESFSDKEYVVQIIKSLNTLIRVSHFWCECIFNRIFNNINTLKIFENCLYMISKKSLLKLFKLVEQESPHHRELINELRCKLEG